MRLRCREARDGILALQRFGHGAYGFFAETGGGEAKFFDAGFERLLLAGIARGGIGGFAQGRFERGGIGAQLGYRFLMRGHAVLQFGGFAFHVLDFHDYFRGAHFELPRLLLIEDDAIFGAIEIEGRLAEDILRAAQFGFELVVAGAEALLLGFSVRGANASLGFGGGHFLQ